MFRWAAWAWMATVLTVNRGELARPWLAITLVGLALLVTVAATGAVRNDPSVLLRPAAVASELAVGASLVLFDGVAFASGHAFSLSQSLGSVWPVVGVLTAGIALGPTMGGIAGVGLGVARGGSAALNGAGPFTGDRLLSLVNTGVFYALAGGTAGYVVGLLRRAEREISAARAREELARTLHDGVLQTLAIVERRADDPALARLARNQERELRTYLFGTSDRPAAVADLGTALAACVDRFEDMFGGRVQVLIADDLPSLRPDRVEALAGAVGEALTNAGKHGEAATVTVYLEPDDDLPGGGVFCSVKDDGYGFDVASTPGRVGLKSSITGRMEELGGRAEVVSVPGAYTEVRLWLPSG